jgi:hypothetical protein
MMFAPSAMDALQSLCPAAEWAWVGAEYSGLVWHSPGIAQPSEAEIEAERARLIAQWHAAEYARLRALEYPGLDALTVALWEHLIEGRTEFSADLQAIRLAIKEKYPRPV